MIGFYNFIMTVVELIYLPIMDVLASLFETYGTINDDITTRTITLGIGQVEWFTFGITELLFMIVAIGVWFITIRLIYWIIKRFFGMIGGWLK